MSNMRYRPDIDGLRAVAILAVVFFHLNLNYFKGGFVGVDIFFVISGFLITTIISNEITEKKFSFADFYLKRVRRISPSFLLVSFVTIFIGYFILNHDEYIYLGKSSIYAGSFWTNVWLKKQSGYFDSTSDYKPFLHYWSLALEEQFYFIWPLVLFALINTLKINKVKLVLIFLLIISFSLSVYTTFKSPDGAFYLIYSRFWQLAIGGLLTFYNREIKNDLLNSISSIVGSLMIGISILIFSNQDHFPGFLALLPTFGALILIITNNQGKIGKLLFENKIAVYFGKISYPLYLWHWPIIFFLKLISNYEPSKFQLLIAFLLSIFLAHVTTFNFEIYFRKLAPRSKTVFGLILLQAILILSGIYIKNNGNGKTIDPSYSTGLENSTKITRECFLEMKNESGHFCYSENKNVKMDKLVVGDSFALSFYSGIINSNLTQSDNNWGLFSKVDYIPWELEKSNEYMSLINYLNNNRNIKEVFLVFSARKLVPSTSILLDEKKEKDLDRANEYIQNSLQKIIDKLKSEGRNVYFVKAWPSLISEPKFCAKRPLLLGESKLFSKCSRDKTLVEKTMSKYNLIISNLKLVNKDTKFLESISSICNEISCDVTKNEKSFYSYTDHLSDYGVLNLFNYLKNTNQYNIKN